uniref:Reverse transcriptase domain-containing protein n=1 Tax=Tanacetum cinerariifolium TaxID=118510 RepID=A0A699HIQ3_TANCI|nr:reverse transcriptase domain-containing protein [Tanacetum cinerariifolium]
MRTLPPGLTSRNSVKSITRTSYQLSWIKSAMTDEKMSILDWILGKVLEKEQEKTPTTQVQERKSAFDRLSETYSPSMTKSHPREMDSKDPPRGRSSTYGLNTLREDRPNDRERFRSIGESYDDSFSHSYHDGNRSRHMKTRKDNDSPLSSVSRSDSSDKRYRRSMSKRHKSTDEYDLTRLWMYEEEDSFTPRIRNFKSSRRTRMPNNVKTAARVWFDELPPESIDSYKDLKAALLAYFMQQKKYVKDPVVIHNIKQKDGDTIEDFMEHFKVEIKRMKGAPECMRISRFMHGVNNPELTKRLTEHVPKTMEEMMVTTIAFIRGEAAAASKKKGHASWKAQDQSQRQNSDKRSDFRGHSREGRGSNRFTPLQGRRKRFLRLKRVKEIMFPPLTASSETEGPLVIEAETGGHMIHRMYVDGGSSMEILYEHCFNRLWPEIKSQMVPATTSLTGFSGETIWPLGQLRLLVIIGHQSFHKSMDEFHDSEHWLNIREGYSPVRQKKRGQAPERVKAIQAEVQKLVKAGIMRGVYYHDWLSNPVMCFLDAYKGYHQIQLAEPDEKMTAFHTGQGVYCYTKMPFSLKNDGATYQRLMDKAFKSQIGRNIKVYVDDLVVKSYIEAEMMRDIEETFRTLRKVNMKINPKKCSFGLAEGMFLGYVVTPEGIKPCPDKTAVVLQLPSPRTIKETTEAEQAFKRLKQHLLELPLLVAPKPNEELIMYLTATYGAIIAVLMTERGTIQTPIYIISHALQGPELNYSPMEKLVLSLVFAAKRLRRYFQAHPITVINDQPIKQVMSRPDVAGRLQKWSIMLGEHNITYRPRTPVK